MERVPEAKLPPGTASVTGIEMMLPDDKQPGYYAQIVRQLASVEGLLDRDKSLLLTAAGSEDGILEALDHYRVPYETSRWLQLDGSWSLDRSFGDYGIETRAGGRFLDAGLAVIVRLEDGGEGEPEQAFAQLEEHAVCRRLPEYGGYDGALAAVDRQLLPLAEGIARAYRCRVTVCE